MFDRPSALRRDAAQPETGAGLASSFVLRSVFHRLIDAVDPDLVDCIDAELRATPAHPDWEALRAR